MNMNRERWRHEPFPFVAPPAWSLEFYGYQLVLFAEGSVSATPPCKLYGEVGLGLLNATLAICSSKTQQAVQEIQVHVLLHLIPWNFRPLHQSFRESNTTAWYVWRLTCQCICKWTELDTGDSTESFCRSRDCDVYLFPAKLSVTESLAFGTLWMFLFSIQASGAGRSTFFFQRCCEGKGKAAYGRHGSGALRIDFQKCVTELSCMTIEELTNCRESLHVDSRRCSLWGLWTVSRECHKILQNCP